MSLPGVFPPVWIAGNQHVDGGVADNVPFDKASDCGMRELLMISCTCCPRDSTPLASPLTILQIGRAHVCTPVTNAHLVCRLMPEKTQQKQKPHIRRVLT